MDSSAVSGFLLGPICFIGVVTDSGIPEGYNMFSLTRVILILEGGMMVRYSISMHVVQVSIHPGMLSLIYIVP